MVDLRGGSRVSISNPQTVVHISNLPHNRASVRNPGRGSVSVSDFLTEVRGAGVYAGNGAPVSIPEDAKAGDNFVDLLSGDWYQLGDEMQWVEIGNIQGPPGDELSPEELQAIVDDAEAEVMAELEPPINLVVLFNNALV